MPPAPRFPAALTRRCARTAEEGPSPPRVQGAVLEFRLRRRTQTVYINEQRSQSYTLDDTWSVAHVIAHIAQSLGMRRWPAVGCALHPYGGTGAHGRGPIRTTRRDGPVRARPGLRDASRYGLLLLGKEEEVRQRREDLDGQWLQRRMSISPNELAISMSAPTGSASGAGGAGSVTTLRQLRTSSSSNSIPSLVTHAAQPVGQGGRRGRVARPASGSRLTWTRRWHPPAYRPPPPMPR